MVKYIQYFTWIITGTMLSFSCHQINTETRSYPVQISGIYPHLAMYNNEGECGTGAVVPWADRLWVVTYGPHKPFGSSDKLYEITPDLDQIVREESIGGTPANRMIHRERNQLFIGPYVIDKIGMLRRSLMKKCREDIQEMPDICLILLTRFTTELWKNDFMNYLQRMPMATPRSDPSPLTIPGSMTMPPTEGC